MKIYKAMKNTEIADLLRAVAAAYKIKREDKNKFRIIAYERAADAVEHASSELKDLWDDAKLEEVAGIGESIAKHLGEIFEKGKSTHFKKVMEGIPPAVFDLIPISGLGPSNSLKLVDELNISSKDPIGKLLNAAEKGKIENLEGFGKDSQSAIIKDIKDYMGREKRLLLNYATKISEEIINWMKKSKDVEIVDPLGSLRRKASTVGDIDISVASKKAKNVIDHFVNYPKKQRIIEKGERTASIIIPGDVQVDLMVQPPESYGSLLQHFTGSKHHNIALREYAQKKKLSLSEYGIKIIDNKPATQKTQKGKKTLKKFADEESFYKYLGMEWIPPELREDNGEIEAAVNHKLPELVKPSDIKADLQIHSDFDIETSHDLGESTIADLVKKANELGYQYIAFTEHNPSHSKHKESQIMDILKRKKNAVEQLNSSIVKSEKTSLKKVFNSLEIDILPTGKLAINEKALDLLDFALVSIHSSFSQSREKMTQRVLAALQYPKVKIFAHPTARKLNEREGVELDWGKIFDFCKRRDIWLEINADPMRLDLPDVLVKDAIGQGILLTLGTDAHNVSCMDYMTYGVSVARRGWCKTNDIVNTRSLEKFEEMIR